MLWKYTILSVAYFARIDFNCSDEVELFDMVDTDDAEDSEETILLVLVGADDDKWVCWGITSFAHPDKRKQTVIVDNNIFLFILISVSSI